MSFTFSLAITKEVDNFYLSTTPDENTTLMIFGIPIIQNLRKGSQAVSETQEAERMNKLRVEIASKLYQAHQEEIESITRGKTNAISEILKQHEEKVSKLEQELIQSKEALDERGRVLSNLNSLLEKQTTEGLRQETIPIRQQMSEIMNIVSSLKPKIPASTIAKAQAMEGEMEELIIECFNSPDFKMLPKQNFSGDHIFEWGGLTIMWEDKNYERSVPAEQVDKALRDFNFHKECDVLVFVSLKTNITTRESPHNIKVQFIGGRLALFISKFQENPDPKQYVCQIIQQIIGSLRQELIRRKTEPNDGIYSSEQLKLKIIQKIIPNAVSSLKDHQKTMNEFIGQTKVKFEAENRKLQGIIDLLFSALKDEDGAIEEDEEEISSPIAPIIPISGRRCGVCRNLGHNAKNCPRIR